MLIIPQEKQIVKLPLKVKVAKKLKTKCCKKYNKGNRCKKCPCFDLMQKAS